MRALVCCLLFAANPDPVKLPTAWPAAKARLEEEIQLHWTGRQQQGRNATGDLRPAWGARMAPPLPQVWPPDGTGGYVVHAFAAGPNPGVHDGEEVAAPWADWLVSGHTRKIEDRGALKRLGMQGVRPLQADEREVARTAAAAEGAVVALTRTTRPKLAPLVKRYYCQWTFNNAVIAAELKRLHPEFFQWLGCH